MFKTKDHWPIRQVSEVRSPCRHRHRAFGSTTSEHRGQWRQARAVCRSDPQSPCRSHARLPITPSTSYACKTSFQIPEPYRSRKKYFDSLKHICLHENILSYCHGHALRFDWGAQVRTGPMFDRMGGMHIRLWTVAPRATYSSVTMAPGRTIRTNLWSGLMSKSTCPVARSRAGMRVR